MKEKIKIAIISFILGAIIFSSISVYAILVIESSDVTYKKKDGTNTNVENALNELYGARYPETFTQIHNTYQGARIPYSNSNITLQKGRYIVIATENYISSNVNYAGASYANDSMNTISPIVTPTGGTCKLINNLESYGIPTEKFSTHAYAILNSHSSFYDCTLASSATLTASENLGASLGNEMGMSILIEAIKLE